MKNHYESSAAASPTSISRGQRVPLKHFTREDGLDPMYKGPYDVIEVSHPNVKITREAGKHVWVHMNNCKVIPHGSPEPLTPEQTLGDPVLLPPGSREEPSGLAPGVTDTERSHTNESEEDEPRAVVGIPTPGFRRSTRVRKKTDFFGNPKAW